MLRRQYAEGYRTREPHRGVRRQAANRVAGLLQGSAIGSRSPKSTATARPTRPLASRLRNRPRAGHLIWGEEQIEQFRAAHPLGSMARLSLELMLNIAARRNDARLIGCQQMSFDAHLQFWKLTWRPFVTDSGRLAPPTVLHAAARRRVKRHGFWIE
jgi:hypothetical protein